MSLRGFLLILLKGSDRLLSFIAVYLIKVYKAVLSPVFGTKCRFYPSCSQYGLEAIRKYGFFYGVPVLLSRLVRCNPLNDGGYDPLK